ncbi:MAG: hypothetical protein ACREUC_15720, partial [Steroidobacteraceae bacterium]
WIDSTQLPSNRSGLRRSHHSGVFFSISDRRCRPFGTIVRQGFPRAMHAAALARSNCNHAARSERRPRFGWERSHCRA